MFPRSAHTSSPHTGQRSFSVRLWHRNPGGENQSPSPTDMALVTEGGVVLIGVYKHGPPNGGRPPTRRLRFLHTSLLRLCPIRFQGRTISQAKASNRAKNQAEYTTFV